jgi:hypothetical protein
MWLWLSLFVRQTVLNRNPPARVIGIGGGRL